MPFIVDKTFGVKMRMYSGRIGGMGESLDGISYHSAVDRESAWDVSVGLLKLNMQLTDLDPEQYAITEASFLVVRLLQTYDQMEWLGETGRITKGFGLIMYPAKGVPVRFHKAS